MREAGLGDSKWDEDLCFTLYRCGRIFLIQEKLRDYGMNAFMLMIVWMQNGYVLQHILTMSNLENENKLVHVISIFQCLALY